MYTSANKKLFHIIKTVKTVTGCNKTFGII